MCYAMYIYILPNGCSNPSNTYPLMNRGCFAFSKVAKAIDMIIFYMESDIYPSGVSFSLLVHPIMTNHFKREIERQKKEKSKQNMGEKSVCIDAL